MGARRFLDLAQLLASLVKLVSAWLDHGVSGHHQSCGQRPEQASEMCTAVQIEAMTRRWRRQGTRDWTFRNC